MAPGDGSGDEAMSDRVDDDAEAFEGAPAQQVLVAGLGEDHFVDRNEVFDFKDCEAGGAGDFPGRGLKQAVTAPLDCRGLEGGCGEPAELGTRVDDDIDQRGRPRLIANAPGDGVDSEDAHGG